MDQVTATFGSFAVDDIAVAREFYARTLGLAVRDAAPGGSSPLWIAAGEGPAVFVLSQAGAPAGWFHRSQSGCRGSRAGG